MWTVRRSCMHSRIKGNKSPTKAEQAVREMLEGSGYRVIAQPCRLFPLPDGGTYTPDFLAWKDDEGGVVVAEVKGGYRGAGWEQGEERYRRAAAAYDCPQWRFCRIEVDVRKRSFDIQSWGDWGSDITSREEKA